MATTLPNMGLVQPTLKGDRGAWDIKVNANFGKLDEHDHTPGKGLKVPVAGLDIDTDLPLAGHAIDAAGKIVFQPVAVLTSGLTTLFVNVADNELYYRTAAGANIKMTSGGGLNISLVGGIVGDYAAVGAEVAYDDANKRYTFKQAGSPGGTWARLASGPVRIHEHSTTESVYVEHAVAAGLAAPYTVTWPAALPATQQLLQVTASGLVVFSNTLATDQNLKLQGTAYIQRGSQTEWIPFFPSFAWLVNGGSPPSWTPAGLPSPLRVEIPGSADLFYPITIGHDKKRVLSIIVVATSITNPSTFSLYRTTGISTTPGDVDSSSVITLSGAVTSVSVPADSCMTYRTLTLATPFQSGAGPDVAGETIFLRIQAGAGGCWVKTYGLVTDIV